MPIREMDDDDAGDLVGIPAIAEEVQMNPSSVRKWVSEGRLPARKVGRRWMVSRANVFELAASTEWSRASAARTRVLERAEEHAQPARVMEHLGELPERSPRPVRQRPRAVARRVPAGAMTLDQFDMPETVGDVR